ncbi:uncharacterized protein LOC101451966 [Ceratitis capitata]|uniref:uncharacterized protein LOC101451966 n=1 Tax=Ceratitis capitata TaxID=7213 RepID=UPI000A0F56F9|nr:uncharacterized protein LOC101451966 [Ceratitis capitata]
MKFYAEYHYDGDCGLAKVFMSLSGWAFSTFSLDKLPNGYVENEHFGPRVVKYDWFPLLVEFPMLFGLLIAAAVTAVLLLFWLCCKVKGLQKCRKIKNRCCHCLITLLLILLLLPLATGLYMTFRTNYLLRRIKDNVKDYRDINNSTIQNLEHQKIETNSKLRAVEYKSNSETLDNRVSKSTAEVLIEWLQDLAHKEHKNLQTLKYLYNNREHFRPAVKVLRDYALKLVIFGVEMDDLFRIFSRETMMFLRTSANNTALKELNVPQEKRINVWHLHSLYLQFAYLYEYLEHLLSASENILHLQNSLAELTANPNEGGMIFKAQTSRDASRDSSTVTDSISIPKIILYLAMAAFFLNAALTYILLMAVGFGIFRHYEEANCLLKFFFFLNVLTIGILGVLSVLHFLFTMVLHTGICHKSNLSAYRLASPPKCPPVGVADERSSLNFSNTHDYVKQEEFFNKLERVLPRNIFWNFTGGGGLLSSKDIYLQKKWFEDDIPHFLTKKDIALLKNFMKEHNGIGKGEGNNFLCKLNSIPNAIKNDLYEQRFLPIAKMLHEALTKLEHRALLDGFENFMDVLKSVKSELDAFDKFYKLSRDNLFIVLKDKIGKTFPEEVSSCPIKYQHSENTEILTPALRDADQDTKCGCREDWLMIYAIGSALLVLTLFLAMILSLLLYKFYKRGPPILSGPQARALSNAHAQSQAAGSEPPCPQAVNKATYSTTQDKDCIVDMKGAQPTNAMNYCEPLSGASASTGTPLINTVNFIPPAMGPFGCQPCAPVVCPQQQMHAGNQNRNDGVILPLKCQSRTQVDCAGSSGITEAQLVGGGTTKDKTVTVMVFQGPKDRQPLVTYPSPGKCERKINQKKSMKLSVFKTLPVVPYSNRDLCGLPLSVRAIIEAFATRETLDLPRQLTEEYVNCTGLGYKLLNNDWRDYFAQFPWLTALLTYTALLPILCVIWCCLQFRPKRIRRFEKSPVPSWRFVLSTVLFLLKIVYSFFVWFTYKSHQNHPTRSHYGLENNANLVRLLYDQTLDVIDHITTENSDVVQEFMKQLANDMIMSLNASAPLIIKNPAGSMLLDISAECAIIQPIIKDMRKDMQVLLADIMQLTDLTRFFYRNTTTLLLLRNISDPKYRDLISNEMQGNILKIMTLLNIDRVLSNIEDIVEMSLGLPRLREAFVKSLADLHNFYAAYFTNLWQEKVKEMNGNYLAMTEAINKLKRDLPQDVTIHLPNDIYSYQLFFLIIAMMISLLCWLQLGYAVYHTVYMRFKKSKYILVSIVVFICLTSIILCLIACVSFFVGTSFYNFRQDTERLDNHCGLDTKPYCDAQNKILSTLGQSIYGDDAETYTAMEIQNQRVYETLRAALPSEAGISNILQMLHFANFSAGVFNSGAMFRVVQQELNMESWYEAYELLSAHVSVVEGPIGSNKTVFYEKMLACNLHLMRTHLFDTLLMQSIFEKVNELSKNAELLAAQLNRTDMRALLGRSLSEMRELHDFFELKFKDLLNNKTQRLLMDFDLEMMLYMSHVAYMPSCREFKMSSIGIPRDLYECIERSLHGFWIGAFSILILLFPILIICMLLTYLYDRYPYATQSGASSRSSQRDGGGTSSTASATGSDAASTGDSDPIVDDEFVGEPSPPKRGPQRKRSRVTFETPPTNDASSNYKVASAPRSGRAKIRDIITSIFNSSAGDVPTVVESKISHETTTSEESMEVELA